MADNEVAIEERQPPAADEGALTEFLLRAFALLTYGVLVVNVAWHWWLEPDRVTLVLLLVTESFTMGLVLFARRARQRDLSPIAVLSTVYATFFFVLFGYDETRRFVPELAGAGLQLLGLAWQVGSKATLGRCFGLLPAARGLVTAGPYRIVRHPIYLGYFIAHAGFLATNFSWRNLAVIALLYTAQLARMVREESVLAAGEHGAAYRDYCRAVRYRLVPGLI